METKLSEIRMNSLQGACVCACVVLGYVYVEVESARVIDATATGSAVSRAVCCDARRRWCNQQHFGPFLFL